MTLSVTDTIEYLGFGKFQWRLLIICILFWISDSIEITLTSILGPVLLNEWHLTPIKLTMLSIGVFVGLMVGSPITGKLCDIYGRRKVIILSLLFQLFFGILSSLAPSYTLLVVTRMIYGVFLSSLHQVINLMLEYSIPTKRDMVMTILAFGWSIGSILTCFLAKLIIPALGWRLWLLICCLPSVIAVSLIPWYPESILFLSAKGDKKLLDDTIASIAKLNDKPIPNDHVELNIIEDRGNLKDMFNRDYLVKSISLIILSFSIFTIYYGTIFLQTLTLQTGGYQIICSIVNLHLKANDYILLIVASSIELLGSSLFYFTLGKIGRKFTFSLGASMALIAYLITIFSFNKSKWILNAGFCLSRFAVSGLTVVIMMYTSEIYPTKMRGLAVGISGQAAKLGAACSPLIAQELYFYDQMLPHILCLMLSILALICIRFLPETNKKPLMVID